MAEWHELQPAAAAKELGTSAAAGLGEAEAGRRHARFGPNEIEERAGKSAIRIFLDQFADTMVMILIIAMAISALFGDLSDAIAIGAIVLLNAALGFTQERRAGKAMAELKKLAVPFVRVKREGTIREIPAPKLVPGDIVLLEAGSRVAADCRVIESADLETHEATLTGESMPVQKVSRALKGANLPLAERNNMVYMGTSVMSGRGEGVVVATGMQTELGRIAGLIQSTQRERTPLQKRLGQLGKTLAWAALAIVLAIFGLGWLRGENLNMLFLTAVSVAVAVVPEGFPAVMAIALTLGAQRMLKRHVLMRKISAVETLGSVTVICSDKTGTLTENEMAATVFATPGHKIQVKDRTAADYRSEDPEMGGADISLMLAGAALCNDAVPGTNQDGRKLAPLGDPTESALVTAAAHCGLTKPDLDRLLPRVSEIPFSSERKRMTTVHRLHAGGASVPEGIQAACRDTGFQYIAFTKGAVDTLLGISSRVWIKGGSEPLTGEWRGQLLADQTSLTADGMRVLGVAYRGHGAEMTYYGPEGIESDLTFVGMIGMTDPPRPEAAQAVAKCKTAGIRPVMITGDHPLTARYIAGQVGIDTAGSVVTGGRLEQASAGELERIAESASVYARVSPEHKLRVVEAFHRLEEIVAMTGDGVNDAPALKKADIGVAMGMTGTDVAKEAAEMVLLDDNFSSIVAAVEEGRVIYDNIRKFIRYILGTNFGEICVMLAAPFCRMPLPLLPVQILWMNLVTDGLPALALGVEPAESNTMRRSPRPLGESMFAGGMGSQVVWAGLLMGIISLAVGYGYWRAGNPAWQTMMFTTLTFAQMANVLAIRSERRSLFQLGLLSNKSLLAAVSLTMILQLVLLYVPFFRGVFKTVALPGADLLLAVGASSIIFWTLEMEKWVMRRVRPED